jgi:propanol-preferring alcohol dehydrogenase
MRVMVLHQPAPVANRPLQLEDVAVPSPGDAELLVRVEACGICRTDLHVVEGELPRRRARVIPGHQVVGRVTAAGRRASRFAPGSRVGIAWLRWTCGRCRYCSRGQENLCLESRYTGYHADGGFAEYAVVHQDFAYAIPPDLDASAATPLLCAGIIGYRALRRAGLRPGCRIGLYGFGASAHIAIQVARHLGCEVYVMTRDERHQRLARDLGAVWTGGASERPPAPLDSAVVFAPAGELVLPALEAVDAGGTVALAGIYMTPVPAMDYERYLFRERCLCSVTANTRQDGEDLLRIAAEIPIRPRTTRFRLEEANEALYRLKHDAIEGAGVLTP